MKIENELFHKILSTNHIAVIPNFYFNDFECDLFAINKNLYTTEYEIKTSKADFKNDFYKNSNRYSLFTRTIDRNNKHFLISSGKRTNRFYFVTGKEMQVDIPEYAGLIQFEIRYGLIHFHYVKRAPRLHKNKVSQELINQCLTRLTWKYYKTTRE